MGSIVSFGLEGLELDWGKNSFYNDHSALFRPDDVEVASYFYAEGITEQKPAFVRPLKSCIRRLELLGYTLERCAQEYQDLFDSWPEYYDAPPLSYDEFSRVLARVNVRRVRLPEDDGTDCDLGEYASQVIMADPEFAKLNAGLTRLDRDAGTFFENVSALVILRLLAENPQNLDLDVVWRTADVVEGGYVAEEEIYTGVSETQRCLIVTEGSTDASILQRSVNLVAPDVADFFDFVDMTEHYPFTGTGNLWRFCQGLARIRIQNRVLVLLDNDTSGRDVFQRISGLDLPPRMRVTLLPELADCRSMETLGPTGGSVENVNGRAVSIESFLDLARDADEAPRVRWTAYNEAMNAYQGELVGKQRYVKKFFKAMNGSAPYDISKLSMLWDHIVAECTRAQARRSS